MEQISKPSRCALFISVRTPTYRNLELGRSLAFPAFHTDSAVHSSDTDAACPVFDLDWGRSGVKSDCRAAARHTASLASVLGRITLRNSWVHVRRFVHSRIHHQTYSAPDAAVGSEDGAYSKGRPWFDRMYSVAAQSSIKTLRLGPVKARFCQICWEPLYSCVHGLVRIFWKAMTLLKTESPCEKKILRI